MRKLVLGIAQRVSVRRLAAQPLRVMAVAIVPVARDHVDVVVAVIGQLEFVVAGAAIAIRRFVVVILAVVAPGIAEALLATALGLVAAIPAVVIYNGFARAVAGYRQLRRRDNWAKTAREAIS